MKRECIAKFSKNKAAFFTKKIYLPQFSKDADLLWCVY